MYDIFFISYNEIFSENNYQSLRLRFPMIKRVKNIKGLHRAHMQAAMQSFTKMFWVVDADAIIVEDFNFDFIVPDDRHDWVYVWHSRNPINDLEYGYGGVKLLPRDLVLNLDTNSVDMTTSISENFNVIPVISNITYFNTDPFNTWKSAFRECVKLSSKIITRQDDYETEERLNAWCTIGKDKAFGEYAIIGANQGKDYAKSNSDALHMINDFDWLKKQFEKVLK